MEAPRVSLNTALLGLDLSPVSGKLVEWAPYLLRVGTSRILLAHVIPVSKLEHVASFPVDRLEEELEREALRALEEYARRLREAGFEVEVLRPLVGEPAPVLARLAAEHGADYIVVADRGQGWLRRLLIGSTVDELVDVSEHPILVGKGFRSDEHLEVPGDPFQGPVIVGVDFGPETGVVVDYASYIALRTDVELIVVHVVEEREQWEEASGRLESIVRSLEQRGVHAEPLLLHGAKPGRVLVRLAEEKDASLIVIGYGGEREGFLLRGSTADTVVRRASRHVFLAKKPRRVEGRGG